MSCKNMSKTGKSAKNLNYSWQFAKLGPRLFIYAYYLSVATPAEPRGEKNFFVVQILGGEKLLKLVEKCRWNIFKRPERG